MAGTKTYRHDYVPAQLGHSSACCRYCSGTPAENAALGEGDVCHVRTERAEKRVPTCCALGCGQPLSDPTLPFCDECMEKPELLKAWEELS